MCFEAFEQLALARSVMLYYIVLLILCGGSQVAGRKKKKKMSSQNLHPAEREITLIPLYSKL